EDVDHTKTNKQMGHRVQDKGKTAGDASQHQQPQPHGHEEKLDWKGVISRLCTNANDQGCVLFKTILLVSNDAGVRKEALKLFESWRGARLSDQPFAWALLQTAKRQGLFPWVKSPKQGMSPCLYYNYGSGCCGKVKEHEPMGCHRCYLCDGPHPLVGYTLTENAPGACPLWSKFYSYSKAICERLGAGGSSMGEIEKIFLFEEKPPSGKQYVRLVRAPRELQFGGRESATPAPPSRPAAGGFGVQSQPQTQLGADPNTSDANQPTAWLGSPAHHQQQQQLNNKLEDKNNTLKGLQGRFGGRSDGDSDDEDGSFECIIPSVCSVGGNTNNNPEDVDHRKTKKEIGHHDQDKEEGPSNQQQ
ncbi:MAG: hypothetical protein D6722_23340, partial [Bacteroidetes bacterium]